MSKSLRALFASVLLFVLVAWALPGTTSASASNIVDNSQTSLITYTGAWTQSTDSSYYNGTKSVSNTTGSQLSFTFIGTEINVYTKKTAASGKYDVYLDGVYDATADAYSAVDQAQMKTYSKTGLSADTHTIELRLVGQKNTSSTGYYVGFDYVSYEPAYLIKDNGSASVTYAGTWTHSSDVNFYDGTKSVSSTTGSKADLTFTGTDIHIYTKTSAATGKYDVYLDGVYDATVDTYSPGDQYKVKTYSREGLSNSSHTVSLRLAGQKNTNSGGYFIGVDYFEYGVGSGLGLNDMPNYRVFQRGIGSDHNTNVTLTGSYNTFNTANIQARVVGHGTSTEVVPWTTIVSSLSGGTYTGSLSVPQGGWYNIQIRARDSSGNIVGTQNGTNKWGVGIVILAIGQSNMVGYGQEMPYVVANDLVANFTRSNMWSHLVDPYDGGGAGSSMVPALGNALTAYYNIPVAFVPAAVGGTSLIGNTNYNWSYRNTVNHADTAGLYGNSVARARAAGGVELLIWNQGEQDSRDHNANPTYDLRAAYKTAFTKMISNYREDLYSTIPIFINQVGQVNSTLRTDAEWSAVRSAQSDLDNGTNILLATTEIGFSLSDTVHFSTASSAIIGPRYANAIKYYFGDSSYYRGPRATSAAFTTASKNEVDVTLTPGGGTDFTPTTGITGFQVWDGTTAVAITSASRLNGTTMRLQLAASVAGSGSVTYQYGMNPVSTGMVRDNTALQLPLEPTGDALSIY